MCRNPSLPCGDPAAIPSDCQSVELGVAFFDLSRIPEWGSSGQDKGIAGFFQKLYAMAARHLEPAGGRIVKLMGDAGLCVFPREQAEDVILALAELCKEARQSAVEHGIDAYLNANVHFGPVLAGSFGPPGAERYDVVGKTVNIAARLGRRGLTLSAQAFRCLSAEGRERFQKIMQPITYQFRF